MFVAAPVLALASVRAGWILYESAAPGAAVELWVLLVAAVLAAGALAGLAMPVRRAASILWRWAQGGAVAALAVSVGALYLAARLADTLMLAAGLAGALLAIMVNIALWSTALIAWCDTDGSEEADRA
ncbi:hypothetical protein IDM40_14645 [Nocardiopsis sp. HNM0947]|uniref:Integral membrane protein n=2 Tax=Nocardiopsis coralli TaxID=2772213 RepID=A0ABR9P7W4_9ACTN|nr:hypothetical protein [Nocardiopsis coralli]